MSEHITPNVSIENKIYIIRGHKVMLDEDLAELYEVEVKRLKRQVRRNLDRFPPDFMFELSNEETQSLRSHFGTLERGQFSKFLPYVFTEQGVSMLSSVLNSKRAVMVNIEIMRTFARLRELISGHKDLQKKIDDMEKKYDGHFKVVFDALKKLLSPPEQYLNVKGFIS